MNKVSNRALATVFDFVAQTALRVSFTVVIAFKGICKVKRYLAGKILFQMLPMYGLKV
jgi:hypothetical protein